MSAYMSNLSWQGCFLAIWAKMDWDEMDGDGFYMMYGSSHNNLKLLPKARLTDSWKGPIIPYGKYYVET